MMKFVVLLYAVSCALGAAIPEGMLPQLDGRIVGGDSTTIEFFPYQISVNLAGYHYCGGSMYSDTFAISAAHCFKSSASMYTVRAGSSFCNSGGDLRNVAEFTIHEGYNPSTMVNDIAVVKLMSPFIMSPDIQPIALATTAPANGASATVSGWGTTSSGGSSPSQLRYAVVNIIGETECRNSTYGYGTAIKESMICAYDVGKDSCQGDSGGPLVSDGLLVGVVSWGKGCAYPNYPGVYANVANLYNWIVDTVSKA